MQGRCRAADRRALERPYDHVDHGRPRLHPGGHADHRHPLLARQLGEPAARREHHPPRPGDSGGFEAGERLLGLARVARTQDQRVGVGPGVEPVASDGADGPRGAVAQRRRGEVAADRGAAHAADHEPPAGLAPLDPGRLHSPERVAELAGLGEHVTEHPGRVRPGDGIGREPVAHVTRSPWGVTPGDPRPASARAPASTTAPSSTRALGSTRAPSPTTARRPTVAPAPMTARGPTRAASPTLTRSASTLSTTAASGPTSARSCRTERSTRASVPTEQCRPRTVWGPT